MSRSYRQYAAYENLHMVNNHQEADLYVVKLGMAILAHEMRCEGKW